MRDEDEDMERIMRIMTVTRKWLNFVAQFYSALCVSIAN